MPILNDLASVSKKQGVAAAVALGLLLALLYFVRLQANAVERQAVALEWIAASTDALGDLVISSCDPSSEEVKKFETAKKAAHRPSP